MQHHLHRRIATHPADYGLGGFVTFHSVESSSKPFSWISPHNSKLKSLPTDRRRTELETIVSPALPKSSVTTLTGLSRVESRQRSLMRQLGVLCSHARSRGRLCDPEPCVELRSADHGRDWTDRVHRTCEVDGTYGRRVRGRGSGGYRKTPFVSHGDLSTRAYGDQLTRHGYAAIRSASTGRIGTDMSGSSEDDFDRRSYWTSMRRSIAIGPPCSEIDANTAEPWNRYSLYERSAWLLNPSPRKMCCDKLLSDAASSELVGDA